MLTTLQKAATIHQSLVEDDYSAEQGLTVVRNLVQTLPEVANATLCLFYGISVHLVKDSPFADTAPDEDQDKWFVSVIVGSSFDDGEEIALSDTMDEAFALAVKHFRLMEAFEDRALTSLY